MVAAELVAAFLINIHVLKKIQDFESVVQQLSLLCSAFTYLSPISSASPIRSPSVPQM